VRVTYLHQYFATRDGTTGTRSYEFARRLVSAGHAVTVITSSAQLPTAMHGRHEADVDGIRVVIIDVPYHNHMPLRERLSSFLRFAAGATVAAARTPADVIVATSTPLTIAIPGLAARVARRAPMVFEVRDLWPSAPIALGALRNPVLRSAARALEWAAYHGARQVIALSPGMADGVAARGVARSRITVIPNACDRDLFEVPASAGAEFRERAQIPPEAPLVVYTGALGRLNDVAYLADVARRMRELAPDVRFLVVGDGQGREELVRRASGLENFAVSGPVPKRDVPAILSAATVATSLFARGPVMTVNSANKFFDALAAGRPLAINYDGWHRELLTESGAGIWLDPDDPAAAARALAAFIHDGERLAAARAAASGLARERFDRDQLAESFIGVVTNTASS
jgi:glycosyltransferase involved in cell wall biosynthesis